MKAFRFRLERVRQIRETQRRESQARFLEVRRQLAEQVERLIKLQHEQARAETMYSGSARGVTYSPDLQTALHYLKASESHVAGQVKQVVAAEEKVEAGRRDLVQKTKDKKILDLLRERRQAEYSVWRQREKQKQIDDTARQNYLRRR